MKCPLTACALTAGWDCKANGCFMLGGIAVSGHMTDADHEAMKPYYDATQRNIAATAASMVSEKCPKCSEAMICVTGEDEYDGDLLYQYSYLCCTSCGHIINDWEDEFPEARAPGHGREVGLPWRHLLTAKLGSDPAAIRARLSLLR